MEIYSKNIYEIIEKGKTKHILILYNISSNHYVGVTVHSNVFNNSVYVKSINRYIDVNDLNEYNKKNIKRISLCKRYLFKSFNKRF